MAYAQDTGNGEEGPGKESSRMLSREETWKPKPKTCSVYKADEQALALCKEAV